LALSCVLGLAGYTVGARLPRPRAVLFLVAGEVLLGVGAVTALARGALGTGAVGAFVLLAAAGFVGDNASVRRCYVAERAERERAVQADRADQAVRDERLHIAQELHDVIAHSLTVVTVQAGVGRRLMAKHPEQAEAALAAIEATGRSAQDELRVALGLLRDNGPGPTGLAPAPGLAEVVELAEAVRAAGTPVELRTSGTGRRLSPALELSVYRVVQEALTNVAKHAPGARASVELVVSARELTVEVTDDGGTEGPGPRPGVTGTPTETGHGLMGMKERVGAFGGSLVAEQLAGHGFRVLARIPLAEER
jgi:signal transduction histidine kinase